MLALRDHTWSRVVLPVSVCLCVVVFLAHRVRLGVHTDECGLAPSLLVCLSWQGAASNAAQALRRPQRRPFEFQYGKDCATLLNSGNWTGRPPASCPGPPSLATCGVGARESWQWSAEALRCGASRQEAAALRAVLAHRWVVVAGDSIGRFFFAALLRLLSNNPAQQIVFGHQNFEYVLPGNIRATFLWAPYGANLTAHFREWGEGPVVPDAIVLSAGLWHMLHVTDVTGFAAELARLKAAALGLLAQAVQAPPISYFSISEVYPPKLKTEEKRQHLTPAGVDAYNLAIATRAVLAPAGPLHLVDIHGLTHGCGPECTHDGLHYSNATYDSAVQVWANTLRALL